MARHLTIGYIFYHSNAALLPVTLTLHNTAGQIAQGFCCIIVSVSLCSQAEPYVGFFYERIIELDIAEILFSHPSTSSAPLWIYDLKLCGK